MTNATQAALQVLVAQGYRITKARRLIIEAIAASHGALTITELAQAVQTDEASVYRTIEVLRKEGVVEEIVTRGQRARFALRHGHHHHVVCRRCGLLKKIACNAELPAPKQVTGFSTIDEHEVTFYGLCQKCVSGRIL